MTRGDVSLNEPGGRKMEGNKLSADEAAILDGIKLLHQGIRTSLTKEPGHFEVTPLTSVKRHGDVSYQLDFQAEDVIDAFFKGAWHGPSVTVTSEGLGTVTYPQGIAEADTEYRILIDPVDGTRELMYDKRSAWILTGVAENKGPATTLRDIFLAVQTELPTSKQTVGSVLWARRGQGCMHEVSDVRTGEVLGGARSPQPSSATDIEQGFSVFVDFFFPGPGPWIATLAHDVLAELMPGDSDGAIKAFGDQYISTGGQMFLLATGAYRMVADLRPRAKNSAISPAGFMCAHPYDLSTALIASEAGVIITDSYGKPLNYALDTQTDCAWIGYANSSIREQVQPVLNRHLERLRNPGAGL